MGHPESAGVSKSQNPGHIPFYRTRHGPLFGFRNKFHIPPLVREAGLRLRFATTVGCGVHLGRKVHHAKSHFVVCSLFCLALWYPIHGSCQLSQNSGINSGDTWVAVDLTVTGNTQITLPASYYNPSTQTTSSTLNNSPTYQFHVESGYDSNGGLVMNLCRKDGH